MKSKKLAGLLLLIATVSSYADDGIAPRDYSIVPPSPEVASLMDFKDYPVDYYHGIPSITFPIYTIKSGAIEMPITISYHGGGVRADQKIGNAGLSWSVMCGATISHTVYGAPDDANESVKLRGFYHLTSDELEFRKKLTEKQFSDPQDPVGYKRDRYWQTTLGDSYYKGQTDIANDIFNLMGYNMSATFVRDKNGKVTISSDAPLKISKTNDIPKITDGGCDGWGFLVTDDKGIQYEFLTQDRTRYDYYYGNPLIDRSADSVYYASAWHLDKITDLSGNTVNFKYKERSQRDIINVGNTVVRDFGTDVVGTFCPKEVSSLRGIIYHPQLLDEIEANGIKVKFNYLNEGNASKADALIGSIDISAPDGKHRIYTFNYDRNLLVSIQDGEQKVYSFEYNKEWGEELYAESQDFGGYCNENIGSIIPDVFIDSKVVGRGADRSVSLDYAHTLELTKITYPTGGYTEFEWENNTFSHVKSAEYHGTINSDDYVLKVVTDTLRYCVEKGYSKCELTNWKIEYGQRPTIDFSEYFKFEKGYLYNTSYVDRHGEIGYNEVFPPYYPHVVIRHHQTNGERKIEKVYFLDKETIEGRTQPINLSLEPGTYDFELKYPNAIQGEEDFIDRNCYYQNSESGYIYVSKSTLDTNVGDGRDYWCGMRIKRIKSATGDPEDEPLRKDYYYNTDRHPTATTGTVQLLPEYGYKYYISYPSPVEIGNTFCTVYCASSAAFPNTVIGTFSSIEYPKVRVCMGGEIRENTDSYLSSMSEVFTYSSAMTEGNCDYINNPFWMFQPVGSRMYTSMAHRRGNLEKHHIYNGTTPIHTTEYYYNINESSELPFLTTDAFAYCDYTRDVQTGGYDYGIGQYTLIPYNKTVSCVHSIEEDGINSYKTFEYFYDSYTENTDYGLVKSVTETDASGLEITTYYTYLSKNGLRLPYPETVVTGAGSHVISAERIEYDAAAMLPLRKYTLSGSCALSDLISSNGITTSTQKSKINNPTFSYRYNAKGNLIQISYKDVVLASYIWGYNGLYPVLEATGIDFNTLTAATAKYGLLGAEINAQGIASDARISAIAGRMRDYFPNNTITAISYDWFNGILRLTDGRGVHTTNGYDDQGRLTSIRDFNNYLISKYEYHYATDENYND
ncbi:MAG: hypothetical protein K2M55_07660 [Muribaculaceae bacterium]|nr:hypothetical protein [Muribaculaceae bacterium]